MLKCIFFEYLAGLFSKRAAITFNHLMYQITMKYVQGSKKLSWFPFLYVTINLSFGGLHLGPVIFIVFECHKLILQCFVMKPVILEDCASHQNEDQWRTYFVSWKSHMFIRYF